MKENKKEKEKERERERKRERKRVEYRVVPGHRNWQIETAGWNLDVRLDI